MHTWAAYLPPPSIHMHTICIPPYAPPPPLERIPRPSRPSSFPSKQKAGHFFTKPISSSRAAPPSIHMHTTICPPPSSAGADPPPISAIHLGFPSDSLKENAGHSFTNQARSQNKIVQSCGSAKRNSSQKCSADRGRARPTWLRHHHQGLPQPGFLPAYPKVRPDSTSVP